MTAPTFFSVAVYDLHLAYGGPEEGGWYYDAGIPAPGFETLTRIFPCVDGEPPAAAYEYRRKLGRAVRVLGKIRGERDYSSVLADGNLGAECAPGYPAPFPKVRPHYD